MQVKSKTNYKIAFIRMAVISLAVFFLLYFLHDKRYIIVPVFLWCSLELSIGNHKSTSFISIDGFNLRIEYYRWWQKHSLVLERKDIRSETEKVVRIRGHTYLKM